MTKQTKRRATHIQSLCANQRQTSGNNPQIKILGQGCPSAWYLAQHRAIQEETITIVLMFILTL